MNQFLNLKHHFGWIIVLSLTLALLLLLALASTVDTARAEGPSGPTVHAVLFHSELCGHCKTVLTQVFPPLQQKYGARLDIRLVETTPPPERAVLRKVALAMGVASDQIGVPFLVIGDRYLLGADQIAHDLPGLIDQGLAAGGVAFPATPGLEPAAEWPRFGSADTSPSGSPSQGGAGGGNAAVASAAPWSDGFTLAVVIMLGMVAALVYVGWLTARGVRVGLSGTTTLGWALPVVALIGLAVAGYLAYVETRAVAAICGPVGDCNAVQSSPYAKLFGVPVGVIGMLGYVGILLGWLIDRRAQGGLARLAALAVFGMALFGVLFSLYLTYLEPFVIGAVCIWCLSSAVLITLVMLLSARPALIALAQPVEEPAPA